MQRYNFFDLNTIIFSTGSNIGDRLSHLHFAENKISTYIGKIIQKSSIYESKAWGKTNQSNFLNQVLQAETNFDAFECLNLLQKIEKERHRKRKEHWGPRTLDIDILFFNDEIISSPHLTIPHPFIEKRKFVLLPLSEILSDFVHPILQKNIKLLLKNCKDKTHIELYNNGL